MISTRVGYTGGRKPNPTYYSLGNHTEAFQVDFAPEQISYQELINIFWRGSRHTSKSWGRQYMTAVFTHGAEQKQVAEITKAQQARAKGKIHTQILPLETFYLAEDYHQKYSLRQLKSVENEFKAIYPKLEDFVNSTAVTRANALVGGYGSIELLKAEIDGYGLSEMAQMRLREATARYE